MTLASTSVVSVGLPSSLLCGFGTMLTKSHAFQVLVSKAFEVCDDSEDGVVDETELYAGLLLVHLNLAKYAGPAACYPPTRSVCDRLFQAADRDNSGGLNRSQFHWIMGVMCAQILSRMLVYYVVLILGVPILATGVVRMANIPKNTYLELATRESISCGVFFLAIPLLWNTIDARYSGSDSGGEILESFSGTTGVISLESPALPLPLKREEQRQRRRQRKSRLLQPHEYGEIAI